MLNPSLPPPSAKAPVVPATWSNALRGVRGERAALLAVLWEVVTRGPVLAERHRAELRASEGMVDGWRVPVRMDDVRAAWDAWLKARHEGAPAERVRDLRDELDRLARAAIEQDTDLGVAPVARRRVSTSAPMLPSRLRY